MEITLQVNGASYSIDLDPRTSLLDALRDTLHLFGTKKGCNQGACGACTVLSAGERINACLALAVQYAGREITTIEGVGSVAHLHVLQQAFIRHDGFQCGYCTPGQICSAIGMLREFRSGLPSAATKSVKVRPTELSPDELKERMSGNICRCGAYEGITDAILEVFQSGAL